MRTLITGATGFIGDHPRAIWENGFRDAGAGKAWQVRVLARDPKKAPCGAGCTCSSRSRWRQEAPGSPRALISAHDAALALGAPLPTDLQQGRAVREIVRRVWPRLSPFRVEDILQTPLRWRSSLPSEPVSPRT